MLAVVLAALAAATPVVRSEVPELDSRLRFGLSLGEPLALTVASDLSQVLVLQTEVGISVSDDFSGLLTMDVVYRANEIFGPITRSLWAMPYVGLGLRVALGRDEQPDRFGFRVPVGLSFRDATEPIEVFLQAAVGLSVLTEVRGSLDAGGGLRIGF